MTQALIQPSNDPRAFRNTLGRFATGVVIVTGIDRQGLPMGLTVNSFNSVSLSPPLVLWSLDLRSVHLEDFQTASHYAINVLSIDQEALSNTFARPSMDRFSGIDWQAGLGGTPLLVGCVAQFEVRNAQQVAGGDHRIFIGEVERCQEWPERAPLLYHAGRYNRLA